MRHYRNTVSSMSHVAIMDKVCAVFANTSLDGEIALSHRHPVAIAEDEHEV